jgi:hypothetical protein
MLTLVETSIPGVFCVRDARSGSVKRMASRAIGRLTVGVARLNLEAFHAAGARASRRRDRAGRTREALRDLAQEKVAQQPDARRDVTQRHRDEVQGRAPQRISR